jgi:hypothetical protein
MLLPHNSVLRDILTLAYRRNWFLERVLKLGLTMVAKEYQCVGTLHLSSLPGIMKSKYKCLTCPDPAVCARLLEEKWRQAYHSVFRFGGLQVTWLIASSRAYVTGPPQPSMVFRYLRMLEGVSPPLALTQTACQATAKAFIVTRDDLLQATIYCCLPSPPTVFDRMFSLGVRGVGMEGGTVSSRSIATPVPGSANGPRRHFLYCVLKSEVQLHRPRRSGDVS